MSLSYSLPGVPVGGLDTPELVLRVWRADDRVPGLFDGELVSAREVLEHYHDLTLGQVEHVAREHGARIERVGR